MKGLSLLTLLLLAIPASAQVVVPGSLGPQSRSNAAAPSFGPVTAERLVRSDAEPWNWLHYSGNYYSQRFSQLDQVGTANAGRLRMQWAFQLEALDRAETTPLVVDGVMFVTEAPSNVIALDARTGEQYWRYNYPLPEELNYCCGRNNRGVAILGDRLFMSTLDAHLVAIDARTGTLLWDTEVARAEDGYSKTAAPLVVGDKVVTGIAGGEFGIRGFVDAYDAETGERVWRFWTTAGPDDPEANATWSGDSWMIGGAATWMTGSYDPELNLVYWGTGNPGPDWNGDVRLGDNLYSDCVLALDADTGELRWYFQFTPHDEHDWDSTQIPLLADTEFGGRQRKVLLSSTGRQGSSSWGSPTRARRGRSASTRTAGRSGSRAPSRPWRAPPSPRRSAGAPTGTRRATARARNSPTCSPTTARPRTSSARRSTSVASASPAAADRRPSPRRATRARCARSCRSPDRSPGSIRCSRARRRASSPPRGTSSSAARSTGTSSRSTPGPERSSSTSTWVPASTPGR